MGIEWQHRPSEVASVDISPEMVAALAAEIGSSEEEISTDIRDMVSAGLVVSPEMAAEVLRDGPKVEGFESGSDISVPNETVQSFMVQTFGKKLLRQSKVALLTKDEKYLLYMVGDDPESVQKKNALIEAGIVSFDDAGAIIAETVEAYQVVAQQLEGVATPEDLQHLYKVRAHSGLPGWTKMELHSFALEVPEEKKYLRDLPVDIKKKRELYLLGTIAHEVAHRIDTEILADYGAMIQATGRTENITEYIKIHREHFKSEDSLLLQEDFAESVRLFITNQPYIQEHYPERYTFLAEHFPDLQPYNLVEEDL